MRKTSVIELLKNLKGGLYVYNTRYRRVGEKVEDKFNLFRAYDQEIVTEINNIVTSSDKMNVSITSRIDGIVNINPIQAEKLELDTEFESNIFRTHSIVLDSKLNVETLVVLVGDDILQTLLELKLDMQVLDTEEYYDGYVYNRVEIDLYNMPIVNDDEIDIDSLVDKVEQRDNLKCLNKVIKYHKDLLDSELPYEDRYVRGGYNHEQIELLKEHGIDASGNYVGISPEKVETGKYYTVDSLKLQLKGQSTIPSVNAVLKKVSNNKNLNKIERTIKDLVDLYNGYTLEDLENENYAFKLKLNEIELDLMESRIKMLAYDEIYNRNSKVNLQSNGNTLVVNHKIVEVNI